MLQFILRWTISPPRRALSENDAMSRFLRHLNPDSVPFDDQPLRITTATFAGAFLLWV
jgi:hypothetical protein